MRTLRVLSLCVVPLFLSAGLTGIATGAEDEDPAWPRTTYDLAYGDDIKQVIHAYELEPRDGPRPGVIFIHGGGLIDGSPLWDIEWAQAVAEQGFVTFMAGYRLFDLDTGENAWPTQLEDVQRAIRWVRAHADEFNVDPERLCVAGYSAGGYLVGLLGTLDDGGDADPALAGYSSRPDCVVMGAGDGDLTVPYPERAFDGLLAGDVMASWLGGTIEEVPAVWEAASPAHNVDEDTPPFLVIHGTDDEFTPVEMARRFVDALRGVGGDVEYVELPGSHMQVAFDPALVSLTERFLVERMDPAE